MTGTPDSATLRMVTVSGVAELSDEEIETIVKEWDRVQITDPETGEVLHDGL